MSDFEEVYSLLFTGIIILFLFLSVYNIVSNFDNTQNRILTSNLLISKALFNPSNAFFINLETNKTSGNLNSSITTALPILINNSVGVIIVGN